MGALHSARRQGIHPQQQPPNASPYELMRPLNDIQRTEALGMYR